MNKIASALLFPFIFIASIASATTPDSEFSVAGGVIINKDSPDSMILLACQDQECRTAVISVKEAGDGQPTRSSSFTVPTGNDVDSYQERWGQFISVSSDAMVRMPKFPSLRYFYYMENSKKKYREAFKLLEDPQKKGQHYALRALYYRKLVEAVLQQ